MVQISSEVTPVPIQSNRVEDWECNAYHDFCRDKLCIVVKRFFKNKKSGKFYKRGVMITLPNELLHDLAEGMEYHQIEYKNTEHTIIDQEISPQGKLFE